MRKPVASDYNVSTLGFEEVSGDEHQSRLGHSHGGAAKVRCAGKGAVSEQPADTAEGVDYLAQYEQALRCTSREELVRRSLEAMGKYTSGHTDLAENHDKHWADATYERLRG